MHKYLCTVCPEIKYTNGFKNNSKSMKTYEYINGLTRSIIESANIKHSYETQSYQSIKTFNMNKKIQSLTIHNSQSNHDLEKKINKSLQIKK